MYVYICRIKIHAEVFGLLLKDKFPQLASHLVRNKLYMCKKFLQELVGIYLETYVHVHVYSQMSSIIFLM